MQEAPYVWTRALLKAPCSALVTGSVRLELIRDPFFFMPGQADHRTQISQSATYDACLDRKKIKIKVSPDTMAMGHLHLSSIDPVTHIQ